jgi:hypothetical protein
VVHELHDGVQIAASLADAGQRVGPWWRLDRTERPGVFYPCIGDRE